MKRSRKSLIHAVSAPLVSAFSVPGTFPSVGLGGEQRGPDLVLLELTV